jgi:polyhydroxyalkanoate synthase
VATRTPKAPKPAAPDPEAAARAFGSNVADFWKSMTQLQLPVQAVSELQARYLQDATQLWNQTLQSLPLVGGLAGGDAQPGEPPKIADRRFASEDWAKNPGSAYLAQMYLLNARTLMQMAESVEADEKTKARIRFAVQQWIDASSPANFLAFNPEAQRKALETGGESISRGVQQLIHDLRQGHVSQTDESLFEVGRNVATTAGSVVFENHLFQLIEYAPLTPKVHEKPFLLVPPCINKYYILDLQPDNSFIRHAVEQGHRTFVISWRNADESMAKLTWDDYVQDAVIQAIDVVQAITGCEGEDASVDMLGFCIGGTLLACTLAVLAARGRQPAASLTLLTSFLDFSDTGVLDIFIDEAAVQLREMTIGPNSPAGGGLLKGAELASTFSFLRPNDLVWNYVVGNYLKGETPPPFDLLYWNSDSTNLPGPMYCWYLRNTYHENNLVVPGKVTVCGEPVDLGAIQAPVYLYGSREDHIVPWDGAYRSTQVLTGDKRFVLGASGHIAGVINPPAKKKRNHWVSDSRRFPADAQVWLDGATEVPGSWWPDWSAWIARHAGKMVPAPKVPGSRRYPPIEPAPGRYVKQKA